MNFLFLNLTELGFVGSTYQEDNAPLLSSVRTIEESNKSSATIRTPPSSRSKNSDPNTALSWCDEVRRARADLSPALRISYPCQEMKPAVSAIVCMITDGVSDASRATRVVFAARDYIEGAMSLGASLKGNIDPSQTHQLLLFREGFQVESDDILRLQSVGWVIGMAKNFELQAQYVPKFPRYTKVTAIGLSEYKCVMLMDADTLAVGDLKEVMKCAVFRSSQNRLGGTIDWYRSHWHLFNTGSILWRTSASEMERVFNLTKDPSFMKRFGSDQDFLNNVYPERLNNTLNNEIVALDTQESRGGAPDVPHTLAQHGAVVPLSWEFNAQTHVEVQKSEFWEERRPTVRILHFTEKKGWQCERRYDPPPPLSEMPQPCTKEIPICYCREAYLYWTALRQAELAYNNTLLLLNME